MAGYLVSDTRKVTTHRFIEMKQRGEKISMLTSYDFTTAGIVDAAGIDGILIGDSASNVMAGNHTTLPMTVDQMIYHARSVEIIDTVKGILDAGIPVMGHLGLTPQSINKFGTYAVRAKEEAEAEKLLSDSILLSETGCFAVVLEKVPAKLAAEVTKAIKAPTIGIGAGGFTDGQILVIDDMLGKTQGFSPRFLRRYANLNEVMTNAIGQYVTDVKSNDFPNEQESY